MEEQANKKKRIEWIDIARGIGIFLIVMAHVKNHGSIKEMITYAVPFFFFLAGLTFSQKSNQKEFVKNKIKRLYIPYLVVSSISIFIYLLMGRFIGENIGFNLKDISTNVFGMIYANAALGNMMWNRPLWFIPTLIIVLIVMNFIEQIKSKKLKGFSVIILTAIGMTLAHFNINLPFQIETALSMLIWIYLGITLKEKLLKIENRKLLLILLLIISLAIGIILGRMNGAIEIMLDTYGNNILLYFITTFAWSIAIVIISMLIRKNKAIEFVGRNTLIILLIHKFPILFFQKICPGVKGMIENENIIISLIFTILISIVSIILCLFFDKCLKKILNNIKERRKYNEN